ncbi:MAG: ScpA family protein [Patescibacteria group bacterium]|jgi:segregation and condensation protein A
MRNITVEKFEGPLDLLLQLIETEELDITQVALAQVTEQYLRTLEGATNVGPEELADFLVVAAKLLLIKSRVLLPQLQVGDETEATDLERQLKMYKAYLDASRAVAKIIHKRRFTFGRGKPAVMIEQKFSPPPSLTSAALHVTFLTVLQELEPIISLPKAVIERTVSIAEKIEHIRVLILDQALVSFKQIVQQAGSKTDVIVSFLALLELVKQRGIMVKQTALFDDIAIQRLDPPTNAEA